MEDGSGYQKQAKIETAAEDMDLDESGMSCFTDVMQSQVSFSMVQIRRLNITRVLIITILLQFCSPCDVAVNISYISN